MKTTSVARDSDVQSNIKKPNARTALSYSNKKVES